VEQAEVLVVGTKDIPEAAFNAITDDHIIVSVATLEGSTSKRRLTAAGR
jgi:hypothetical protein